MNIKYCDALVIGGGLAGLRAAVAAGDKGLSTIVLSLVPVKRSHSAAAQGGMQASLANSKMSEGDNEDLHFADTVKGSDWGCTTRKHGSSSVSPNTYRTIWYFTNRGLSW